MKKITLLIAFFLSIVTGINAQVTSYTFSQTSGTYIPITGGTVVATCSSNTADPGLMDDVIYNIPAASFPFPFNFKGTDYTGCNISTNGFITFGTVAPLTTDRTPLSVTTAFDGCISAWGRDTSGFFNIATRSTEIRWEVVGTAPNREIVIQFKDNRPNYSTSTTQVYGLSYQIRLKETSNTIAIVYGPGSYAIGTTAITSTVTAGPHVGLRGATAADYNGRTGAAWATSAAMTGNTQRMAFATAGTVNMPASGLSFNWTPPAPCTGTPVAGTVTPTQQSSCAGLVPAALVATGFSTGSSGLVLQWEESDDNGVADTWANAVGGSGATTATYTPGPYSGNTIYYRLKVTCTASASSALSNITVINPPANPTTAASAITFTGVATNQMTINWANGNGTRRYVVVNTANTFTDPTNGQVDPFVTGAIYTNGGEEIVYDGTGSTVTVTGLTCNTTYYVRVYEYLRCGTAAPFDYYYNVTPATGNPNSQLTPNVASATLPASNNFVGFTGANLSTVFPGWIEGIGNASPSGTASAWFNSTAFVGITTAKVNLFSNTKRDWIVSPKVTITAASRLTFRAAITDYNNGNVDPAGMQGTDDSVDVMISTDGCGKTWTSLYTFNAASTNGTLTNVLKDFSLALDAYIGQSVILAFKGSEGTADDVPDYDFHIANLVIEVTPSCQAPTALTASNVTATTASLGWTANGTATAWNVQYGVTGFALGSGTIVNNVTANPYNVTGLIANTTYQFYVQSFCSATSSSTWSGPYSFTTACVAITTLPWTENFDSLTTLGLTNFPGCWSKENGDWATANAVTYNTPRSGANYLRDSWAANNEFIWTPGFQLTAGTSYDFSTYVQGDNGTTWVVDMFYNNSPSSAGATQLGTAYNVPGTGGTYSPQQYAQMKNSFVPTTSGVYYFAMRVNEASGAPWYVAFDDFRLEVTPACSAPNGLSASGTTPTASTISWTAVAGSAGYQYVLDTVSTDPTGAGTVTTALTYNAAGLTPTTQYYFHLRNNCGAQFSPWTTISFTTPALPPVNDDCAGATTLTVGGSYATGSVVGTIVGATASEVANPSIPAPGCALYVGGDVWFKAVVPASGTITFETGLETGGFTDSGLAVYSGACNALAFVSCNDDNPNDGFSILALTGRTPGETLYARVWRYNNALPKNVDAVGQFRMASYDASLGTQSFDTTGFVAYPNPVTNILNLSYTSEISKVAVHNLLGQEVLTKNVNATQSKIDMSNLANGTYLVKVTVGDLVNTIKVVKQ